jgi:RNA polymerase sigma-70 factor (ECF subfamily)
MADTDLDDQLRRSLVSAWHQYLVALDTIRPDLFRYCRRLTGNLWDAEDLVQETLLKAFAKLSHVLYSVKSPRAYLLRIASNLWIDTLRGRATEQAAMASGGTELAAAVTPAPPPSQTAEMRDAAARLLQRAAPQERAALLLVEIFDMTIEEAADILGTTIGATKSALHRARTRIKDADPPAALRRPRPSSELLDRFVDRYNARDLPALLALMRDDATIEMHGFETEIGREGFARERGWFHHNFYNPVDGSPTQARWQIAEVENQPLVLVFGGMADEQTLTSVMRIEEAEARVQRIVVYALCPDVVREVGDALGHPTMTLGYHFPFDVSAMP